MQSCFQHLPLELVYFHILPYIPHLSITKIDLKLMKRKMHIYNYIRKELELENPEIYHTIFKTNSISLKKNFFNIVTPDLYITIEFVPSTDEFVTWRLVG
jgi:hypothetical protein